MSEWMARASRAQLILTLGLVPGLVVGALAADLQDWGGAGLVSGGLTAVVVAIVLGTMIHGQIRRQTEAVGVLDGRTRRAAGKASLWGPVPEDPETRRAAHDLAVHALAERRRRPVVALVGGLFLLAMAVNLAVRASPWWWIAVGVLVGLHVYGQFVLPARLRRRIELLRAD